MKYITTLIPALLLLVLVYGQRSEPDELATSNGPITIQPVQHASMVITANKQTVYIDPSGGADLFKGLAAPDLIVITDIHGDHFDANTINSLATAATILVIPQAVADKLPANDTHKRIVLNNGDKTVQSGIELLAVPMYNLPEEAGAFHTKGRGNGYVISYGGKRLYISGDTEDIPEMRALQQIDVAFVCMNLPYTMNVEQAADAVLAFKPAIVYPYHYRGQNGLSDVGKFKQLVNAGNAALQVRIKNWYPGK